jgi:two-component system alkaline phosphatase synthesis response regulator PhoP
VCRELRRGGLKTPIILLTARVREAEKVLGLELGADDYVTKPFSPLELRARIKAVLRRSGPQNGQVLRFGDAEVDFERGTARREGSLVELTPFELKVLQALWKAAGRFLSREQLLDALWGPGFAITGRVIDNHVMNLRRKLEVTPSEPRYILSVRGMGYRFDESGCGLTDS